MPLAKISRPLEGYFKELCLASAIQLVQLANVGLVAAALPAHALARWRARSSELGASEASSGALEPLAWAGAIWSFALAALLCFFVYERHPHVPDEVVYLIHASYFADGRLSLPVPPDRVIPIIFLPGIMGSNLRMSRTRQEDTRRADNIGWRPDDLRDTLSRRKDSPAQRQRNFDPDETEVDRYEITEDAGKFDMTGAQTVDADKRHSNVPDGLPNIGLLMSAPLPPAGRSSP